jgi:hypothetical protein
VPADADGKPLEDIRTPADNERVADFITEQVRRLTADPAAELHASIAGGRKTMGFYLGYALSLYGRDQDRLSHVLVSPPFESQQEFFYPTPGERVIFTTGPNGGPLDTRDAQIVLAEIPFVRLRHGLPEDLLSGATTYSGAVEAATRTLGPPEVVIDLAGRRVRAGNATFTLPPAELAFYAWFARRKIDGLPPLPGLTDKDLDNVGASYRQQFIAEYCRIDPLGDEGRVATRLRYGMDRANFEQRKSKLHGLIKKALGRAAAPYLIAGKAAKPRRYELTLPKSAIRFAHVNATALTERSASDD